MINLNDFITLNGGIFGNVDISLIICEDTMCICPKCKNRPTFKFLYRINNEYFQNENLLTSGSNVYHQTGFFISYDDFLKILNKLLKNAKIKRKIRPYVARDNAYYFSFDSISEMKNLYLKLIIEIYNFVTDSNNINTNNAKQLFS